MKFVGGGERNLKKSIRNDSDLRRCYWYTRMKSWERGIDVRELKTLHSRKRSNKSLESGKAGVVGGGERDCNEWR